MSCPQIRRRQPGAVFSRSQLRAVRSGLSLPLPDDGVGGLRADAVMSPIGTERTRATPPGSTVVEPIPDSRRRLAPSASAWSRMGQKRPKLPWLPATKSTTKQRVKFVPVADLNCSAASNPQCATDGVRRRGQWCALVALLLWIRRPSGLRGRPANETYDAGLSLDVDRRIADNFVHSPGLGKHRHMA